MHAHKHTNIYTQIYAHARRDAETKGNPYLCTCNIGIRIISHTKIYIYLFCIHIHYTNMDITYTYKHMYADAKNQS